MLDLAIKMTNIFILGIFENQIWRTLGCVCFGWKSFPEMLFGKCGCLVCPENRIFWKLISVGPKKKALTMEMNFRSYFHFKWIPERERERERARAREGEASSRRSHAPSSSQHCSQAPTPSIAIRDRELAFAPIAIGAVLREIAIDASRDRAVDRHLAFELIAIDASRDRDRWRSRRTGAWEAPRRRTQLIMSVNLGAVFVFLVLSFSL